MICPYCVVGDGGNFQSDHMIPGDNTRLVDCCGTCNVAKSNRHPGSWFADLVIGLATGNSSVNQAATLAGNFGDEIEEHLQNALGILAILRSDGHWEPPPVDMDRLVTVKLSLRASVMARRLARNFGVDPSVVLEEAIFALGEKLEGADPFPTQDERLESWRETVR
jgi:hypothetical protein